MPSERHPLPPLAVTMGDPAGISLEITLLAWRDRAALDLPAFALFADPQALDGRARLCGIEVPLKIIDSLNEAAAAFASRLPVYPVALVREPQPGHPHEENARAILASIELAVAAVSKGQASGIVTNPIAKSVLYAAGFPHPGHTEYLGALGAEYFPGSSPHPVMMLACDELKVVPLTVHIPLADVPKAITAAKIVETVHVMVTALQTDFAISSPRVAMTGLNPHAGENGSLGREEIETILPAIRELQATGYRVTGPHPADTLFHAEARTTYDAVLAMYHDQALIPLKSLAFDRGVNVTLGLPFVRTSPDHGTAFDIAGTGRANLASLVASLRLAARLSQRRRQALAKEAT